MSNRLPVDRIVADDGTEGWKVSPGGLVTALEPVMRSSDGAWVGWAGQPDLDLEPFDYDDMRLVPVQLSQRDVEQYYEGFSNDTIWPLYHDVIAPPTYHRVWWDRYVAVNRRFADAVLDVVEADGTVWVQDYQLQLVPQMLREARPDLTIGFFNHIPFPPYGIFAQLPWRKEILEGLLGADVIGFQRQSDASGFARAVRHILGHVTTPTIEVPVADDDAAATGRSKKGRTVRRVLAKAFPISIDAEQYAEMARRPDIQARAKQIRQELGNPTTIMLGVDRLDYTKGIRHRVKAFGELIADGVLRVGEVTLVQVASPSRERVETYRQLRDEIELSVGRLNGDHGTMEHAPINYLHHGYPREEMVALYLAADVMLVTALRDGMNLVAKEYVASRNDERGALVLSEFAGAADELKQALLINPHDIVGLKRAIVHAADMEPREQQRRMRALRKRVLEHDVARWSSSFLTALAATRHPEQVPAVLPESEAAPGAEAVADTSSTADETAVERGAAS